MARPSHQHGHVAERGVATEAVDGTLAVTEQLCREFPDMAPGHVLAVVVRTTANLRRVGATARTTASPDFEAVVTDSARHRLAHDR